MQILQFEMSPRKKRSATRMSKGKSEKGDEKIVEDTAQNGTRTAFEAFGDESDQSIDSPLRKKQNTAKSNPKARGSGKTRTTARKAISDDNERSVNGYSRIPDARLTNDNAGAGNDSLPTYSMKEQQEDVLDIVPPASNPPIKPAAVATTSEMKIAEKVVGLESTIPTPQNGTCGNGETSANGVEAFDAKSDQTWIESLGWFGVFVFVALFVLSGVLWTGLILSERALYQLESLECRERLHQTYQAMGLGVDFEDVGDSDVGDYILDRFEEQKFYWKELEGQVRHWKKEAKRFEEKGNGFREQCQKDLQQLLSEINPDNVMN